MFITTWTSIFTMEGYTKVSLFIANDNDEQFLVKYNSACGFMDTGVIYNRDNLMQEIASIDVDPELYAYAKTVCYLLVGFYTDDNLMSLRREEVSQDDKK